MKAVCSGYSSMEEVLDFEGFTPEDCGRSLKLKTCIEQILTARPARKKKKVVKRWRVRKSNLSPSLLIDQPDQPDLLKFWHLKAQNTSDTPHTVLDHATWFERILADSGEINMDLTYRQYTKLVNLESSVNATMFVSDSNELTSQRLWKQLSHRTTNRIRRLRMEKTLNLSPLFSIATHRKVWERTGLKCQGGK